MSERIRVGILGAGWAGMGHAIAFSRLPGVEIAALWSRKRTTAESLAGQLNEPKLQIFNDWRVLIENADVDVICLTTPPTLRLDPLIMALKRECHVLVEKPITIGLTDADAISDALTQVDVVTASVYNWRYAPGNLIARRAIEEGQIGKILDIRSEWRITWFTREVIEPRPWMKDFDNSDGILGEGLSHDFDRIRFLTGQEFRQVVDRLLPRPIPLNPEIEIAGGNSIVLAELTDGIMADARMILTAGHYEWNQIVSGETATLNVTHEATFQQRLDEDEPLELESSGLEKVPEGTNLLQYTWNQLIADFVAAIRRGDKAHATVPNLPSLDDGLKVQQIISAVRLSDKERRWVDVVELES